MRELEAHAKALAPVVKGYVEKEIGAMRAEFANALKDGLAALRSDFELALKGVPTAETLAPLVVDLIPHPEDGKDGESVALETVKSMVDDALAVAMESITIPENGKDGKDGADGKSISDEEVKDIVSAALEKALGEIEIVPPADGKDGRDALEIDILPRIDEEKSYQRGSWATHKGGLWRAHSTTDGMRGWECVVDGLHDCGIDQIDARNFVSVLEMASGKVVRKSLAMPTMVYRNVYKAGTNYQAGDVVSFGGSLWHCNEDTDTKPGDGQKCWTLCAKKGRDGKSA